MITKPASSTFDRGGCSHATGLSLRDTLPTDEWDRDFAEQAVGFFSFEILITCTPPKPTGGKFTAAADEASQQVIRASSAAAQKRIGRGYRPPGSKVSPRRGMGTTANRGSTGSGRVPIPKG